ncbi:MAG TPA: exodeoxyribonuclease V subunit alpha, partial [Desulfurivibrionaceae bacterium]|nr:exodeoxyribonuclease V subunit alpha [Desulfurivibrionaceae bacterium]
MVPELAQWCKVLEGCPAVAAGPGKTPLVMEENRLYLRRYWEYEEEVARGFLRRGEGACFPVDCKLLAAGLSRYFPVSSGGDNDGQRLAALVAMVRPLAVITGGPGTGKTTTVASILALLAEQYPEPHKRLRVALAAPTGKAAMRLQESISRVKKSWQFQDLGEGAAIPEQVMTLHRLLGAIGGTASFRHDEKNPLPYDLIVVDEASMVDLPMMAKLFRALRPETRLVLLGDRHQLASVEPGSVLGDLCHPAALALFSKEFFGCLGGFEVAPVSGSASGMTVGLSDSLVELRRSHRFARESGIGRLGAAVKSGDVSGVWEVLADPAATDVVWREVSSSDLFEKMLAGLILDWFAGLQNMTPAEALAANEHFRVLCALRQGPFGAEQVNARIERLLQKHGYQVAAGRNYLG